MLQYIKFFKPFEVLCQFTDSQGRRTLKEFIPLPGIYACGRLDYRSEGLLLLTNDGDLIHQLEDPRFEHPKTYLAQVEGVITAEAVEALNTKILLPGLQSRLASAAILPPPDLPARPVPVRDYHPTSWVQITLCEGKKHQVRRMTAAVGFPTLRLVRVKLGQIVLDNLRPGEWRTLTATEIKQVYSKSSGGR